MKRKTHLPAVPAALADVALIDGPTCAAAAGLSLSAWQALVSEGSAPAPAFRAPRCTRWRMSDVRSWLIARAATGSDPQDEQAVQRAASRATASAQARRRAAMPAVGA